MTENTIRIQKAILHILDTEAGTPVFSNKEMVLELETTDFLENLVQKLLNDDNLKTTVFINEDTNWVLNLCQRLSRDEIDFIDMSQELAQKLYQIMADNLSIPPGDLICSQLTVDDHSYLGMFKLNYRSNYIHYVEYDGDLNVNQLIRQRTVLPGENQKPEESVLISLDDFSIRLIEKEYEVMGDKEYYLSKRFLVCDDQLSTSQKAKIISKVAEKLFKKHSPDDPDCIMRLRKTVAESMDEDKTVAVENVAREIFRDNPSAQQEYITEVKQAGIREEQITLSEKITERQFRNHKIKTDTGIEIYFPSTYYNNKNMIEFINQPNGTVSIIIKNVGKIINK